MAAKKKAAARRRAGAASGGQDTVPEKWRILIFMDVEQRNLIEAAKAQFAEIRLARFAHNLEVRLQVHGHQLEPPHRLGSSLYTLTAGSITKAQDSTQPYIPTNSTILQGFVNRQRPDPNDKETHTAFLYWGHGRGVGLGVESPGLRASFRPRALPARALDAPLDTGVAALTARARMAYAGAPTGLKSLDGLGPSVAHITSIDSTMLGSTLTALTAAARCPLDLVILDSCFMGSLETAIEAFGQTRYLVASQTRNELAGLNLTYLLEQAPAAVDGRALGEDVLRQASQLYSGVKVLVLFDLSNEDTVKAFTSALWNFVDDLSRAFLSPNEAQMLVPTLRDTRWFSVRQFIDIKHFCDRVANLTASAPLRKSAEAVAALLRPGTGGLVASLRGEDSGFVHGPSIYCPWFRATAEEIGQGKRNVLVEADAYLSLRLPSRSRWGALVLALDHVWQAAREQVATYHGGTGGTSLDTRAAVVARGPDPKDGGTAATAPETGEIDGANLYLY